MRFVHVCPVLLMLGAACAGQSPVPLVKTPPEGLHGQADAASVVVARADSAPPAAPATEALDCTKASPASGAAKESCELGTLPSLELAVACDVQPGSPTPRASWDHTSPPLRLDVVERRFGLTADERARLFRDGFVVPDRLSYPSYAPALHDVYRSQLPLYVSVDAVLHAVYRSNDSIIAELETSSLEPLLGKTLESMHGSLAAAQARYPADAARDVDLYLTVGQILLAPNEEEAKGKSVLGTEAEARTIAALATAGATMEPVTLFGRERVIDFTQFRPRGHYAPDAPHGAGQSDLSHYFRAAMWLSRLELNLVSRSSRSSSRELDPRETPREDTDAMALADLARTAHVMDQVDQLDAAWGLLAGRREDVSFSALLKLMDRAKIADLTSADGPERLRAAIGDAFVRTARTHYQAEGSPNLPVIATMLGPRITTDTSATRPLVHPEVTDRHAVPATDIAYALGHDRALAYTKDDLAAFPGLREHLDRARGILQAPQTGPDLYGSWLTAIVALSKAPAGTLPSFMEADAFPDLRMGSAIAAYAQIRHNYVLMVPTTYDEPGCEIPDGFVEPAPDVYAALIAYADRGKTVTAQLLPEAVAYFDRLGLVLRVLARISRRELANEPLTPDEQRFLAMVTDLSFGTAGGYSSGPQGSGWYFQMFPSNDDALQPAALIADYFASPYEGTAYYAGVSGVHMGIFVVDAHAFEAVGPMGHRYTDAEVPTVASRAPWSESYTAHAPPEPPLTLSLRIKPGAPEGWTGDMTFTALASKSLGPVTLELLDHHRVPLASVTEVVSAGQPSRFVFTSRKMPDSDVAGFGVEGLHVRVGDFHYFDMGHFQPDSYEPLTLASGGRWRFGAGRPVRPGFKRPQTRVGL
jgi:hypothetical protein